MLKKNIYLSMFISVMYGLSFETVNANDKSTSKESETTYHYDIQEASLSGIITDLQTGSILIDVNVFILELGKKTSTDTKGIYSFDSLPQGEYKIQFTHMEYRDHTTMIKIEQKYSQLDLSLISTWACY